MSTDLAPFDANAENDNPFAVAADLVPVVKNDMTSWAAAASEASWMPSLRLISGKSKMVGAPANLLAGHFYFCRTSTGVGAQNLGQVVLIVPVASRYKAMESVMVPKVGEKWVSHFDEKGEGYRSIVERAAAKEQGVFYGPEYLVWVDGASDLGGAWALFHCGSATARNAAADIEAAVGKGKVLRLVEYPASNTKFSWEAFRVEPAMAALQFKPTVADINAQTAKFEAEKKLGKVVEADAPGGRAQ